MMVALSDLSIVIVNWNAREELLACLASVAAGSNGLAVETWVVDNASADGSARAVRERCPWARLLENADNLGFPRAVNQALARASGRVLLLLNPDATLGPGTLGAVLALLDRRPEVGAVGCRLENGSGCPAWEGGRRLPRLRHLLFDLFLLENLFPRHQVFAHYRMGDWDHRTSRDVECLCGAFLAFRREVLEAVGPLDESVFLYLEDMDYCRRIADRGWKLHYLAETAVYHQGQACSDRHPRPAWITGLVYRAWVRYFAKHQGRDAAGAARAMLFLGGLFRLALFSLATLLLAPLPGSRAARTARRKAADAAYLVAWSAGALR